MNTDDYLQLTGKISLEFDFSSKFAFIIRPSVTSARLRLIRSFNLFEDEESNVAVHCNCYDVLNALNKNFTTS